MGFNLGAFAGGISKGANDTIDIMNKIDDSQRNKERYDEEKATRLAKKEFQDNLEKLRRDRSTGTGEFEDLVDEGVLAQRKAPAGIATPGQESAPTASKNPLKDGGEGLYRNQKLADDRYYNRLADLQEKLYSFTDPSKAAFVREEMEKLRDADFERQRKVATSALITGAPNALSLANKAYGFQKDGFKIDETSGKFDPEKGWTGVNIVDKDGKVVNTLNLNQKGIMEMYLSGTPDKLVDFNIRNRTLNIAEEKLPFEKDALAATASKDRNIGSYYGGAGAQMKADANQAKVEAIFKPYMDGKIKVDPLWDPDKKLKAEAHNATIDSQVGTAVNLYQDPANKGIKSAGNAIEASRALYDIKVVADPNKKGELGLDLRNWSEPKEGDKFAGSHYIYKGAGGGAVYVPKDRVNTAIDRAKVLATQNKK